jgi:uncharacterized protein (DUF1499 family)
MYVFQSTCPFFLFPLFYFSDYEENVAMINSVMAGITKTKLYDKTANYYDWKEIYPQLKLLQDNIEDLKNDAKLIDTVRSYIHAYVLLIFF